MYLAYSWARMKNIFIKLLWFPNKSPSNLSILEEISPEYSLEGLMLKLKLPILWPPDAKSWLIWKDPDAGKDWGQEEKGMTSLTQWTWVWVSSRSWWWAGRPGVLQSMGSQRVGHDWATELNWLWFSRTFTARLALNPLSPLWGEIDEYSLQRFNLARWILCYLWSLVTWEVCLLLDGK